MKWYARQSITNKYSGLFLLAQNVDNLAEVRGGETVSIRGRIVACSEKRMLTVFFMVSETQRTLASTTEVLVSHADLQARRMQD